MHVARHWASRNVSDWLSVLVQEVATRQACRADALDKQVKRLIAAHVHDEDVARNLRELLVSAQDDASAARASANDYRAAMKEVGALPMQDASLTET